MKYRSYIPLRTRIRAAEPLSGRHAAVHQFQQSCLPRPTRRSASAGPFSTATRACPPKSSCPKSASMGGGFAKIYVFWNQIEPERGRYDWTAVDAFVDQLRSPDEGLIAVYSSSTWASAQPSTMIPASPAKNATTTTNSSSTS